MGSSESTGSSNGTEEEEEEEEDHQPENSYSSGGGSMGAGTAVAMAAAGIAVAAWGISRMISGSTDTDTSGGGSMGAVTAVAMAAAGIRVAAWFLKVFIRVAAWGISRMISGSTDTKNKERDKDSWSPPPSGKFKMNTDGACPHKTKGPDGVERQRGPSGYAGILRDHHGKWVGGFQGFLVEADSLTAELHGIHKGLKFLADRRCYKGSILESDNEEAVKWIVEWNTRQDPGKSPIIQNCWEIILDSRYLVDKNKINICHINGKYANRCADRLADVAVGKKENYVEIKNLPCEIKLLVDQESDPHGYSSPSIYNLYLLVLQITIFFLVAVLVFSVCNFV